MSTILTIRRPRIALVLGLGLSFGLASCNDNNDREKTRTVGAVARSEIAQSTSETADPILINDLTLSGRDTLETNSSSEI